MYTEGVEKTSKNKGEYSMESTGVMHHIRELLIKGKCSSEVINMGYAPGTVYKVQRQVRADAEITTHINGVPIRMSNVNSCAGDTESNDNHDGGIMLHANPPMVCPTCYKPAVHWIVCGDCGRLIPQDCGCPEDSSSLVEGYTMVELLHPHLTERTRA